MNVQMSLLIEDLVTSLEGALVHLPALAPPWGHGAVGGDLVLRAIVLLLGLDGPHEAVNASPELGRRRLGRAGLQRGRQAAVVHGERGEGRGHLGLDVRAVRDRREPGGRRVAVGESAGGRRIRRGAVVVHGVVLLDRIVRHGRGNVKAICCRRVGHGGWHARLREHWQGEVNYVCRVGSRSLRGTGGHGCHVHKRGRTSLGFPDGMGCLRHHDGHDLTVVQESSDKTIRVKNRRRTKLVAEEGFQKAQDGREGRRALGWGIEGSRLKAEDAGMTGGKHVKLYMLDSHPKPSHPGPRHTHDTRKGSKHGALLRIE
jgi:hypothetical protein